MKNIFILNIFITKNLKNSKINIGIFKACILGGRKGLPNGINGTRWEWNSDLSAQESPAPSHQLPISCVSVMPAKKYNNIHKCYTKSPKSEVPVPICHKSQFLVKSEFLVCLRVKSIPGVPQVTVTSMSKTKATKLGNKKTSVEGTLISPG